jgi:dCMP deaminase
MRINKKEYFMEIAKVVSKRSNCLNRQVGSVIVNSNQIISVGYNGPAFHELNCISCNRTESGKDLNLCFAIHAETNAIIQALKTNRYFYTIYTTTEPCHDCSKLIVASGIKEIIYLEKYPISKECDDFLKINNIYKEQYKLSL